jgi:small subunit ribosomal protein S8
MKANICRVLKEEGFIRNFKVVAKDKNDLKLRVGLKEGALVDLQRVSTPGLRIYKVIKICHVFFQDLGYLLFQLQRELSHQESARA